MKSNDTAPHPLAERQFLLARPRRNYRLDVTRKQREFDHDDPENMDRFATKLKNPDERDDAKDPSEPRTARFSEETKKFVGTLQRRRAVADQSKKVDAEHIADEIVKALTRAGLRDGASS